MSQHTFETPLIKANFIKRYKRFFVDAQLDENTVITSHTNNTGSMKGLLNEGNEAWFTPNDDPKRKLKFALEMINEGNSLVGVNTSIPNSLVYNSIVEGDVAELTGYANAKREVKYGREGKSRIDVLLTDENKAPCYVEVKNVTLKDENSDTALFPDAVTTRGTKHLNELIAEVQNGNRAVMFYLVQRSDCNTFSTANDIDPVYAETLKKAVEAGVEVLCYSCSLSPTCIKLDKPLPIKL